MRKTIALNGNWKEEMEELNDNELLPPLFSVWLLTINV